MPLRDRKVHLYSSATRSRKAITRIFSGGVTLSLSAVGVKIEAPRGVWSGEGYLPSPENFYIFYFKMVSFCACLHGFLFGIFLPFRVMPQAVTNQII